MFGLTDDQFKDFNIWLHYNFIVSRIRRNSGTKCIQVTDRKKMLSLGSDKYYEWVLEKIEKFKEINLIKQ